MKSRLLKLSLLVAFSCQPALAGEKTIQGPRLTLAMQRGATTIAPVTVAQAPTAQPPVAQPSVAPADMAPLPSLVAPAPAPQPPAAADLANVPCAQTLTAPPAYPLSATLLKWGRQERRAEFISNSKRRQSQFQQFHPLRRLLTIPSRLILAPYQHPIAADAEQAAE